MAFPALLYLVLAFLTFCAINPCHPYTLYGNGTQAPDESKITYQLWSSKPWKRKQRNETAWKPREVEYTRTQMVEKTAKDLENNAGRLDIYHMNGSYQPNHIQFYSDSNYSAHVPIGTLVSESKAKNWHNQDPWFVLASYRPKDVVEISFRVFAGLLFFWAYVLVPSYDLFHKFSSFKKHDYRQHHLHNHGNADGSWTLHPVNEVLTSYSQRLGHEDGYLGYDEPRLATLDFTSDPPLFTGFGRDQCMQRILCEAINWSSSLSRSRASSMNSWKKFGIHNATVAWGGTGGVEGEMLSERACEKFTCRPVLSFMRFLIYTLDWNTILKATF